MNYVDPTNGQQPPVDEESVQQKVPVSGEVTTGLVQGDASNDSPDGAVADAIRPIRSPWWLVLKVAFAVAALLLLVVSVCFWLATQEPAFYQRALVISNEQAYRDGQDLEIAALYWRNDVVESDAWLTEFTEDQINGWLASELPRKFSRYLPKGLDSPRVEIKPERLRVAFRTAIQNTSTVMVATVEVFPTEVSNRLGVRLYDVRAGKLPIPVSVFAKPAVDLLARQDIDVQWYNDSAGYPVALLTIPKKQMAFEEQHVVVEELEIANGLLRLAGRSEPSQTPAVARSQ